jgi:hypothetical protein
LAGQVYDQVDALGFATHNGLMECEPQEQKLSTTYRDSYSPHAKHGPVSTGFEDLIDQANHVDLNRTNSKLVRYFVLNQ